MTNDPEKTVIRGKKMRVIPETIAEMKQTCALMTRRDYRDALINEGMPIAEAQASTDGHDALFTQLFNRASEEKPAPKKAAR